MKPLRKIKNGDGKVKEWQGIGTIAKMYFDFSERPTEIILIAGDRDTLRKAFSMLCGPNAIFRIGKLRRVKVIK